jgi:hypothetical protein
MYQSRITVDLPSAETDRRRSPIEWLRSLLAPSSICGAAGRSSPSARRTERVANERASVLAGARVVRGAAARAAV